MISKGFIYHLVRVRDMGSKTPTFESVPIVHEFLQVFLDYISNISPKGK